MHGAAISMALHMSVGAPRCCGVIEIYNSRTKFGSYHFHGNALRSMGIYYARINSIEYSEKRTSDFGFGYTTPTYACSPAREKTPSSSASGHIIPAETDHLQLQSSSSTSRLLRPSPSPMDAVEIDIDTVMKELHRTMKILQGLGSSDYLVKKEQPVPSTNYFDYRTSGSCILAGVLKDP
jgi:hypothetical protein